MMYHGEETKEAVRRLASGATIGMVDSALQKEGVGSGPRSEILESARRIVNRRARIKHLLIGAVGLLILAGGGYWYYLCAINQNFRVRIPGVVVVAGLLFAIYGAYSASQNEV